MVTIPALYACTSSSVRFADGHDFVKLFSCSAKCGPVVCRKLVVVLRPVSEFIIIYVRNIGYLSINNAVRVTLDRLQCPAF